MTITESDRISGHRNTGQPPNAEFVCVNVWRSQPVVDRISANYAPRLGDM